MRRSFALFLLAATLGGCATAPGPGLAPKEYASLPLPHCYPAMDDPDYWIVKLKHPDRLLLSSRQIQQLNLEMERHGLVNDVFSEGLWDRQHVEAERLDQESTGHNGEAQEPLGKFVEAYALFTYLKEETERLRRVTRWDAGGNSVTAETFQAWEENLFLDGIRENNPLRYALTRRRTDLRYYPTRTPIFSKPNERDFDLLQVSALQALQPLALCHTSRDGQWWFVVSPYCRGWVLKEDVVPGTRADLKPFVQPAARLVVLGLAVEAAWEPGNTATVTRLYMGTSCPLLAVDELYYRIGLPDADAQGQLTLRPAYISRQDPVQEGFLPCTPRNIYTQAFRMLHTPYAWGGKGEHRDCSQLIQDVYATMGLIVPRNSASQAQAGAGRIRLGRELSLRQRQEMLNHLDAPAWLQFPGHIMLYLGRDYGHYYVVHDIWSHRRPDFFGGDRQVVVGQVVVSDLSLGEGSSKGSLLERLATINLVKP